MFYLYFLQLFMLYFIYYFWLIFFFKDIIVNKIFLHKSTTLFFRNYERRVTIFLTNVRCRTHESIKKPNEILLF